MKVSSFEAIVEALNAGGVKYLVVGGLAVNAHGYLRFTRDVDLVLRLSKEDIDNAFRAFSTIGYKPSVPVTAAEFSEEDRRAAWKREKGMLVLKLWSDLHPETPIDVFTYEPFDFDAEYARAYAPPEFKGGEVRFVGIPALIAMKEEAGRDQDRIDIKNLKAILDLQEEK